MYPSFFDVIINPGFIVFFFIFVIFAFLIFIFPSLGIEKMPKSSVLLFGVFCHFVFIVAFLLVSSLLKNNIDVAQENIYAISLELTEFETKCEESDPVIEIDIDSEFGTTTTTEYDCDTHIAYLKEELRQANEHLEEVSY